MEITMSKSRVHHCSCYNEEDSIDVFLTKINSVLMNEPYQFEIIFINDGSGL